MATPYLAALQRTTNKTTSAVQSIRNLVNWALSWPRVILWGASTEGRR
jgi:hypothetical protein